MNYHLIFTVANPMLKKALVFFVLKLIIIAIKRIYSALLSITKKTVRSCFICTELQPQSVRLTEMLRSPNSSIHCQVRHLLSLHNVTVDGFESFLTFNKTNSCLIAKHNYLLLPSFLCLLAIWKLTVQSYAKSFHPKSMEDRRLRRV